MNMWQLRQTVESAIPAWVLFVPVIGVVAAWLVTRRD